MNPYDELTAFIQRAGSARAAARLIGVTSQTLANILVGAHVPSLETIEKLHLAGAVDANSWLEAIVRDQRNKNVKSS